MSDSLSNIHCTGIIEPGSLISENKGFLVICQECNKEFKAVFQKMTVCKFCLDKIAKHFLEDAKMAQNGASNSGGDRNPVNEILSCTSGNRWQYLAAIYNHINLIPSLSRYCE